MAGLEDPGEGEVAVLSDQTGLDTRGSDERCVASFGKVFLVRPGDVEGGVLSSDPLYSVSRSATLILHEGYHSHYKQSHGLRGTRQRLHRAPADRRSDPSAPP